MTHCVAASQGLQGRPIQVFKGFVLGRYFVGRAAA